MTMTLCVQLPAARRGAAAEGGVQPDGRLAQAEHRRGHHLCPRFELDVIRRSSCSESAAVTDWSSI